MIFRSLISGLLRLFLRERADEEEQQRGAGEREAFLRILTAFLTGGIQSETAMT